MRPVIALHVYIYIIIDETYSIIIRIRNIQGAFSLEFQNGAQKWGRSKELGRGVWF